jgi:hypothetical protein
VKLIMAPAPSKRSPGRALLTGNSVKLLLGLIIACAASTGMAMRCNGQLVDDNDWPVEVREKCGEPDYVATYPEIVAPGLGHTVLEHWYYNPGPQAFIRRLTFRGGRLHGVETLGYGFIEPFRDHCAASALQEGMSEFELYARCGEPLARRNWWQQVAVTASGFHAGYRVVPVEEWLYDFGRTRFRRVVRLENGRVTDISSTDRPD